MISRSARDVMALGVAAVLACAVTGVRGAPAAEAAGQEATEGGQPAAEDTQRHEQWVTHTRTAQAAFRRRDFATAEAELTAAIKVAEAFGPTDRRLA